MTYLKMKFLLPLGLLFAHFALIAQNTSQLQLSEIMKGEDFVGYSPGSIEWSPDSQTIYFSWNPDKEALRATYKVSISDRTPRKVSLDEQQSRPENGTYNEDRSQMVYSKSGDIFLYETSTGKVTQITNTLSSEYNPQFRSGDQFVVYTTDNNLYAWEIATGSIRQLTDFKEGSKKEEKSLQEYEEWLKQDQLMHFDILAERKDTREKREARNKELKPERPLTIYMEGKSVGNIKISPDMAFVTYRLTKSANSQSTEVPNYVTESGFTDHDQARVKVGAPQDTYEMGVYDIAADTAYIVDIKQIPGIYDRPAFRKEYEGEDYKSVSEEPREVIMHGPFFSQDGKMLLDIRSMDNKDRWIMLLDGKSGLLKLIDRQHDDAWVGGPGIIGWNFYAGNMGWFADDQKIWFQSEETGYSHLYSYDIRSEKKKALTSGEFEIRDAFLANDKQSFYIKSNKKSPYVQHFYQMSVKGGKMTQITEGSGRFDVSMSPNEEYLAIRHSKSNQPWELYLMKNEPGAEMTRLTKSTTAQFEAYNWRAPEIVTFDAADGAKVPARLYKPDNPNGAAVIFVHGAGYLQNVHEWWSSYYREYMFHNLLTDLGYTVLDIDYRGSDGYGRDWRTGIYRWMGGKDLSDQIDGTKYLINEHNIDKKRIGIYGGSYGGFITLMAMFTSPQTFQAGAALRSVTDWAHYNHPYTSNILNTPVADSLAFVRSSPIYHADGLAGRLVILHGMVDDNVQFQDVVRLSQRLIELGKKDWDMAVFPMEPHGFREASSWTDEYRRILELFEEELK